MQQTPENENIRVIEISNPQINIDLLNFQHLVNPESCVAKEFNEFLQGLQKRLLSNDLEQKALLDKFNIQFYIQDRKDNSIARAGSADYKINDNDFTGNDFAIIFNRQKLAKLKYVDQLAYVLGHELSHLVYRKGEEENDEMKYQHSNEEVCCDLNSLRLMRKSGFNMQCGLSVNDFYVDKAAELKMRIAYCDDFVNNNLQFDEPVTFEAERFTKVEYVMAGLKFDFPQVQDSEEQQNALMIRNLNKVMEYGDRIAFRKKFNAYLSGLGSEKASKFVVNLMAEVIEKFPAVDEFQRKNDYRKYLNHPVCVMMEVVSAVGKMEGKKLYPPRAAAKVNSYLANNPNYYNKMEREWEILFKPKNSININCEGR